MSNTIKKQPKRVPRPLLEGHLVVPSTGSIAGDRRRMKILQATIKEAVKSTQLATDPDPHLSIRRIMF
jgi:hypothetical protein